MSEAIALVDIGGSAVKVSIYSSSTDELISATELAPPAFNDETVTQDPANLLGKIVRAMNLAGAKLSPEMKLRTLYVSSIRQGFCLISNNEVVTPLIYNGDTSGKHSEREMREYGWERLYEETGHWFAPQLTFPKILTLKRKDPTLFHANTKLAFIHDWLIWALTGVLKTEMTLVSAGQMALLRDRDINEALLERFGFDRGLLPQIGNFGEPVEQISPELLGSLGTEWQGCTVHVGGGDSHFLHMGASNNQEETIVISAGSSTPITYLKSDLINSGLSQPWKSTSFAKDLYTHEGNCGYPGTYFGWLATLATEKIDLTNLELSVKSIENVPKVFGSCRHWTHDSWRDCPPFTIVNQSPQHSVEQLMLGLTLDYAFALKSQVIDLAGGDSQRSGNVVMTGGGANLLLSRVLQTILGNPVEVMDSQECAKNALYQIATSSPRKQTARTQALNFPEEVRDSLLQLERVHGQLYSSIEGTGEVIRNVA